SWPSHPTYPYQQNRAPTGPFACIPPRGSEIPLKCPWLLPRCLKTKTRNYRHKKFRSPVSQITFDLDRNWIDSCGPEHLLEVELPWPRIATNITGTRPHPANGRTLTAHMSLSRYPSG